MADSTFQKTLDDFDKLCGNTRDRLGKAQAQVFTEFQAALDQKKDYWMSHALDERIPDLYPPEMNIAANFQIAAHGWGATDSDLLKRCSEVLISLDKYAYASKRQTPSEVKSPNVYAYEHTCYLRQLVRLHWGFLDGLRGQQQDVLGIVGDQLASLEQVLKKLAWFTCVFVCYAHKDNEERPYLSDLLQAVRGPLRQRHIFLWWDRKPPSDESDDSSKTGLLPGQEWNEQIKKRLSDFDVALALISPNFDVSDYIQKTEIASLLKNRQDNGLYLIPIKLLACGQESNPEFCRTQGLPADGNRMSDLYNGAELSEKGKLLYTDDLVKAIEAAMDVCS
jgi:hypothetical protein